MSIFPGLFMVLTVMTLNILGEALRDSYERGS
jgi:ABC-type dipeptide/oligopeptide/nickel transport system permease subunit